MNVPSARPMVSRARIPPVSGMGAGGVAGVLVADVDILRFLHAPTMPKARIARKLFIVEAFSAQTAKSAQ
ncbi:hypothetical protein BTHE68_25730 [Burkholderia sp. THE68]|nr:hypothetical protein BTHE68_25730 [Burkholderia sp. THE68]